MNLSEHARQAWNDFFFTGYTVKSLGLLRVVLAAGLLLFHVTQYYSLLLLDPGGARFAYMERVWYFDWLGFERHSPLLAIAVFGVLMASTVTMMLGKHTRLSIVTVLVTSIFLQGARDSMMGDTHHRLLIPGMILLFLALSPSGRAYSLDERNRSTPGRPIEPWEASWPIRAMQLYTASFYFWSMLAKLRVSGASWFLEGGKLQEILLRRSAMWGLTDAGEPVANVTAFHLAHQTDLVTALAIGTLLFEAGFGLVLFIRSTRLRVLFLLLVTVFHILSFVFLYVGFVMMPVVFVIFFDLSKFRTAYPSRQRSRRAVRSTPAVQHDAGLIHEPRIAQIDGDGFEAKAHVDGRRAEAGASGFE